MKSWFLAAALLGLAACGGTAADDGDAAAPATEATASGESANGIPAEAAVPAVETAVAVDTTLQVSDIDAYVAGMHAEIEKLQAAHDKAVQARAAHDDDQELEAMMAAVSNDIQLAGARGAGLEPAHYRYVRTAIDTVESTLDMLQGFRTMEGDTSALQAQVGDPYADFSEDVRGVMQARQPELAQLRQQAMALLLETGGH